MKKATKTIFIIIVIVTVLLLLLNNTSNNELLDKFQESTINPNSSTSSSLNTVKKDFIPDTNYTCEDLILENMSVQFKSHNSDGSLAEAVKVTEDLPLKNNHSFLGGAVVYNRKVGEKFTQFKSTIFYVVSNRVTQDKIIQDSYIFVADLLFDEDSCSKIMCRLPYDSSDCLYTCKILSSSCYWKYCDYNNCYDSYPIESLE